MAKSGTLGAMNIHSKCHGPVAVGSVGKNTLLNYTMCYFSEVIYIIIWNQWQGWLKKTLSFSCTWSYSQALEQPFELTELRNMLVS